MIRPLANSFLFAVTRARPLRAKMAALFKARRGQ